MAKKENLKIKESELKSLQELVSETNKQQLQLGQLETQKHAILHNLVETQKKFSELQVELEKEYGKVSINIDDGTYTKSEEDESNKED